MTAKIDTILIRVADLARSVAFYESLGFQKTMGGASMALLSDGETRFAAVGREVTGNLAGEASEGSAGSSVILGRTCRSNEEVDAFVTKAEAAGATVVRRPASNDWGGYSGAFTDPDGHLWSVGHNVLFYRA